MAQVGGMMASDLNGVPILVWYLLLGAGFVAVGVARLRQRHFENVGDESRARQMRNRIPYGLGVCALIAVRIILGA